MCVSAVLDNNQVFLSGDRHEVIHVRRLAREMNRDHRPRPFGKTFAHASWIEIECVLIDVGKNRNCSDPKNGSCRCDKTYRRHDDLITRTDRGRGESRLECYGPVRGRDAETCFVEIGERSLERLCGRYFGFPPKLLLRRQRFLRSLAQFMIDPGHTWSEAIDGQYYDQAQFVRDFRSFMGMTPSEYADAPHPILEKIMAQRMADQGAAPQTDLPTVLRYGTDRDAGNE